ncbi:MAG: succinate dehydrogenase cytochrome b subunit [Ignavibacteriales bacterium]|nr:MAG: succinate dehydrogenase cytochrome b subunit [Ignavibacteriaceae bacterium]MBW7872571.1 succinate dehydrogenase cytochrome b subunit [Ignavibacteria bacterium]MCZ2141876.1 succinate dehydrogenase cytochrome b subunit [Ignavibacteriales bacterium]OQY72815.1 MAG: hypothetical protein B6D45_08750 [Ignavibacteriales bacterium UTCHB3]MBV6445043.1 hypothetical protein [Ignavibacteriaceae bacterium]
MGWFLRFLTSSVGQKFIQGFTGFFLISFLLVHLAGNLQLLNPNVEVAKESFNKYSEFMSTSMIIRILEIGLVLGFFFHILVGTVLYFRNRATRPIAYGDRRPSKNSSWSSRAMMLTGSLIFVFVVIHLINFFVKARFQGETDMYTLVKAAFTDPLLSSFYIFAMIILGFHLNHGFQSAFQTFGLLGKKYEKFIKGFGTTFAIVISLAFAIIPVFFLIGLGGK